LSTVDNTRDYARVSHSRQWSNYNLDGGMCPLKREQATRVSYNTLTHSGLYCRDREKK